MKSLADQLPPELAAVIHPEWRKNEVDSWTTREQLLKDYRDKWVGFAKGGVIASGVSPVQVMEAAQQCGKHPFVVCVGREEEPFQMRRASFPN